MKNTETRRKILNYLIAFALLYTSVFVVVFMMRSIKEVESQKFLFVDLNKKTEEESECTVVQREDSIRIQKIDVDAPLVFPENDDDDLIDDLDKGVTHFPQSSLPGEEGSAMFLGHSAPPAWPDINYDKVFIHIDQLQEGDKIEIYYNNCLYRYEVTGKEVLDKGQEVPADLTEGQTSSIIIVSCWPPSTGQRRMVVAGQLQLSKQYD